ncbi:hypothetical protein [Methanothermococcus okinawensis]|uniref:Plasmid stabilization system n=1 Tax=Methanothermococcus okinawensis (strain DSM 14208 / JCM 11175 / IH1) TaxID=647113 RepID=F8ALJ1_METOI|nr:hypothetical protein [Methanothermococcus okinawensis]AEH07129.1 hypothetical protein Metok_1161 [Methanothermococcus okinawensis IH1]
MKKIRVILSPDAFDVYNYLKNNLNYKQNNSLFNAINDKVKILKSNVHYGDAISKRLIPKEYINNYGISNLFRVELPQFWRMLYTITNYGINIIVVILDILDHKKYNKKFGYKTK